MQLVTLCRGGMMDQPNSFFLSKKFEFYASDVEKITGVKRARLQTWMERGWITPSLYKAQGSGQKNKFNTLDLIKIAIFKKCVGNGLARAAVADFLQDISRSLEQREFKEGWEEFHPLYIFFLRRDGEVIDAILRNYGGDEGVDFKIMLAILADDTIGINLSKIAKDLKKRIHEIGM